MIIHKRNDSFTRDTDEKYELDTDVYCPICECGIFSRDDIAWNEEKQICHKKCLIEGAL